MANLYERGGYWYARAQRNGKDRRKSFKTKDRVKAEQLFEQWLAQLDARRSNCRANFSGPKLGRACRRARERLGMLKGEQVIYFVKAGRFVKIGTARDMKQRMRNLQTGCPYQLHLIHVMLAGLDFEWRLHSKFGRHRVGGEWFAFSEDIARFILEDYSGGDGQKPIEIFRHLPEMITEEENDCDG